MQVSCCMPQPICMSWCRCSVLVHMLLMEIANKHTKHLYARNGSSNNYLVSTRTTSKRLSGCTHTCTCFHRQSYATSTSTSTTSSTHITSIASTLWKTLHARIEQPRAYTQANTLAHMLDGEHTTGCWWSLRAVHHHHRRRRGPNLYFGDVRSVYIRVVVKAFFVSFCSIAELCAALFLRGRSCPPNVFVVCACVCVCFLVGKLLSWKI